MTENFCCDSYDFFFNWIKFHVSWKFYNFAISSPIQLTNIIVLVELIKPALGFCCSFYWFFLNTEKLENFQVPYFLNIFLEKINSFIT